MKVLKVMIIFVASLCLSACAWPKVYCRSSSGSVTYDRMSHRLEIVWESTTQTPNGDKVTHVPDSVRIHDQ